MKKLLFLLLCLFLLAPNTFAVGSSATGSVGIGSTSQAFDIDASGNILPSSTTPDFGSVTRPFGDGYFGTLHISGGITMAADVDMDGYDIIMDTDGDSALTNDRDAGVADDEIGVTLNSAIDFLFKANEFAVLDGSKITVTSDDTEALLVEKADSTDIFTVDTTNSEINLDGEVHITDDTFHNGNQIYLGASTATAQIISQGGNGANFRQNTDLATGDFIDFDTATAQLTASSGVQAFMKVNPDVEQTGTAGYTGLLVDVTETGTGSGTSNIIDFGVGGDTKFRIDNTGRVFLSSNSLYLGTVTTSAQIGNSSNGILVRQNVDLAAGNFLDIKTGSGDEFTASSGTQSFVYLEPKINQTSTAGYTGLLMDVTETATGSGANNLLDLQVATASKFSVDNSGNVSIAGDYNMNFPMDLGEDSGFLTVMDKEVSATPAAGTEESVYFDIDHEDFFAMYAEADSSGGIQNESIQTFKRFQYKQGTDIASATNIVIPNDGNVFELTGTTKVDLISNIGFQEGATITLIANESVDIDDGTATSTTNITITLAGGADFSMTASDVLVLVLTSTTADGQAWREVSRSVN